jgi:Xaa-Pro aminopeptidase
VSVADRLAGLRRVIGDEGSLLVSSLTNIRYLTGFTGSAGMLFVFPGAAVLLTDGRYEEQAARQISSTGTSVSVAVASRPEQKKRAAALVAERGPERLSLEADHITWAQKEAFADDWFPSVVLCPTSGLVEGLRQVKDGEEIASLADAASKADAALAQVRPLLERGPTESTFGRTLDNAMRELGASGPSFETIVASGPNAAMPHHRPTSRRIEPGEPVVLDFGAVVDGYCSDMTRTVWVGHLDDPQLRRAYEVVRAAQAAGVAKIRPGVACADVDRACREVIAEAGWSERFVHGTGHGVGLDIHEAPSVSSASTDTLVVGHVVTVEPGVYLPGLGGIRIEDTLVVTEDGCRPLTSTAKDRP